MPSKAKHGCGRGSYLITGMGGMGLVQYQYLNSKSQAVRRRSGLLQKSSERLATHDPEDAISCKIQKVQALEALELRF